MPRRKTKKSKEHVIQKKRYNSLSSFKREVQESGIEKIVSFNGYELVTNKHTYGLSDNTISIDGA